MATTAPTYEHPRAHVGRLLQTKRWHPDTDTTELEAAVRVSKIANAAERMAETLEDLTPADTAAVLARLADTLPSEAAANV